MDETASASRATTAVMVERCSVMLPPSMILLVALPAPGRPTALGEAASLHQRPAVGHPAPPARAGATLVQEQPAAPPGLGRAAPQAGQVGPAEHVHGDVGGPVGDELGRRLPDGQ